MADEIIKRDQNFVTVLAGITDDSNQYIKMLRLDPTTKRLLVSATGIGTVTSVSVVSANGFAGTVATATSTPAITLSTTINGIIKGNGTAISAVTIGSGLSFDGTTLSATGGSGITIGTTTITSGDNTKVLYNNSGVVGEYTISGSGNVAMTTSPSFTTPTLGVASATSINKVAITAPATSATLTIADGKTLTVSKTMTFTAADDTGSYTFPTGTKTLVATDVTALSSLVTVGTITSGGLGTGAVIGGVTMTLGSDANYDTYYRNSSGVLTRLANGTTGQVLTATTGSAPSWATPSGSSTVSTLSFSTAFENSARFNSTESGGGAFDTFGISGLVQACGSTAGHYARVIYQIGSTTTTNFRLYDAGVSISGLLRLDTKGTTVNTFYGIGNPAIDGTAGITYTDEHIGLKVVTSGSVATLSATVANGTTETATSLATLSANDVIWFRIDIISSSSVKFYTKINNGAWSSATEITTNIPTSAQGQCTFMNSNVNTASNTRIDVGQFAILIA